VNPLRWLWRLVFEDDDSPPDPDQLVLLALPDGEALARLWQGLLDNRGIPCVVRDTALYAPGFRIGAPRMEILVRYEHLEAARNVLGIDSSESTLP
jgi:hypothetical protein